MERDTDIQTQIERERERERERECEEKYYTIRRSYAVSILIIPRMLFLFHFFASGFKSNFSGAHVDENDTLYTEESIDSFKIS